MCVYKNRYSILSKAIAAVLVCLFVVNDVSWANPSTLSALVGNPDTYAAMRQNMQRRYDLHNDHDIDPFILSHLDSIYTLTGRIDPNLDFAQERLAIRKILEKSMKDSGAAGLLDRLENKTKVLNKVTGKIEKGIQIQLLVLKNDEKFPVFEGEEARGHASNKYLTIFVRENELSDIPSIIGKIFHEIRARSHRPDQELKQFEVINRKIESQVKTNGQILDTALREEFARLIFSEDLDIMHRDYTMAAIPQESHILQKTNIEKAIARFDRFSPYLLEPFNEELNQLRRILKKDIKQPELLILVRACMERFLRKSAFLRNALEYSGDEMQSFVDILETSGQLMKTTAGLSLAETFQILSVASSIYQEFNEKKNSEKIEPLDIRELGFVANTWKTRSVGLEWIIRYVFLAKQQCIKRKFAVLDWRQTIFDKKWAATEEEAFNIAERLSKLRIIRSRYIKFEMPLLFEAFDRIKSLDLLEKIVFGAILDIPCQPYEERSWSKSLASFHCQRRLERIITVGTKENQFSVAMARRVIYSFPQCSDKAVVSDWDHLQEQADKWSIRFEGIGMIRCVPLDTKTEVNFKIITHGWEYKAGSHVRRVFENFVPLQFPLEIGVYKHKKGYALVIMPAVVTAVTSFSLASAPQQVKAMKVEIIKRSTVALGKEPTAEQFEVIREAHYKMVPVVSVEDRINAIVSTMGGRLSSAREATKVEDLLRKIESEKPNGYDLGMVERIIACMPWVEEAATITFGRDVRFGSVKIGTKKEDLPPGFLALDPGMHTPFTGSYSPQADRISVLINLCCDRASVGDLESSYCLAHELVEGHIMRSFHQGHGGYAGPLSGRSALFIEDLYGGRLSVPGVTGLDTLFTSGKKPISHTYVHARPEGLARLVQFVLTDTLTDRIAFEMLGATPGQIEDDIRFAVGYRLKELDIIDGIIGGTDGKNLNERIIETAMLSARVTALASYYNVLADEIGALDRRIRRHINENLFSDIRGVAPRDLLRVRHDTMNAYESMLEDAMLLTQHVQITAIPTNKVTIPGNATLPPPTPQRDQRLSATGGEGRVTLSASMEQLAALLTKVPEELFTSIAPPVIMLHSMLDAANRPGVRHTGDGEWAFVFSEGVTFNHGLGYILPAIAEKGAKVAVVVSHDEARANRERAFVDGLNTDLKKRGVSSDKYIQCIERVEGSAEALGVAHCYYFRMDGEKDGFTEANGITPVNIAVEAVKRILEALGKVCGVPLAEEAKLEELRREFIEIAA